MTTFSPIALRLTTLTTLLTVVVGSLSISHFGCNDTWNPSVACNTKITVKDLCELQLRLANLTSDSPNGTTPIPSTSKPSMALLQLIVTAGSETLRATSIHGVDYWTVGSKEILVNNNGETDIPLFDITITLPNLCGQAYLIVRIIGGRGDTVELSTPIQLKCPEKNVDLALVGIVQEEYDVYSHRPLVHTTGQPLTYYIPNFQLLVRNALKNSSFSARTGPSAYTVSAYIKPQLRYMYQWSFGNNSQQTALNSDMSLLEYQLGDVMLHEGNRLVSTDGGRRTQALPGGSQTELHIENLVLKSKEVCGNAIMVIQLKVPHQPSDSNRINDFYLLPVFIDCWDHNPVETIETCQVIPNYYDGGQTAWITYTVPGQTKVYEYKSEERSVRALNPEVDAPTLQDIALMKLTTDIQSDRLMELGQCVDTMWGSSDAFVTSTDVLLTSLRKYWDEVEPKGEVQKKEHGKISLILNTFSDMLTLALQPKNPLHDWLHVPFQYFFNPLLPYDSNGGTNHFEETNQVFRRKRNVDSIDDSNSLNNDVDDVDDEFEAAAASQQRDRQSRIASTTTSSSGSAATTSSRSSRRSTSPRSPRSTAPTVDASVTSVGRQTRTTQASLASAATSSGSRRTTSIRQTTQASPTSSAASSESRRTTTRRRTTSGGGETTTAPSQGISTTSRRNSRTTSAKGGAVSSEAGVTSAASTAKGAASTASTARSTRSRVSTTSAAATAASPASPAAAPTRRPASTDKGVTSTASTAQGTTASATRGARAGATTLGAASPVNGSGTVAPTTGKSNSMAPTTGKASSMASTARGAASTGAPQASPTITTGKSAGTTAKALPTTVSSSSNVKATAGVSTAKPSSATSSGSKTTAAAATTKARSTSSKTTAASPTGTSTSKVSGPTSGATAKPTVASGRTSPTGQTNALSGSTSSGRATGGQATRTTNPSATTTTGSSSSGAADEKDFGSKPKWHEQVMEQLYEMVKYNGKGMYILTPQRWQTISAFLKTLLYGQKEDFERYSYIPRSTQEGLVSLMKMAIGQNLPRIFDNIPGPIMKAVNEWMNLKYQRRVELGNSACHFQEGFELALNVTEELLTQKQWQDRKDQLVMLAHVFRIVLKDDHTQYLAELYNRISAATKMSRTWMIRDGIPIHEPDTKDICQRYTAVKLWQLRTFPVFQFAGRTVSPDQYQSVFWTQERGTIFRGDRSALTGQVFWSKVATCSCPAGNTCGSNAAPAQNGGNTMMGNSPATGQPMVAAPMHGAQIEEGIDLTNDDDDTDRHDSYTGFEEAEDMMFGE